MTRRWGVSPIKELRSEPGMRGTSVDKDFLYGIFRLTTGYRYLSWSLRRVPLDPEKRAAEPGWSKPLRQAYTKPLLLEKAEAWFAAADPRPTPDPPAWTHPNRN
jgi:hypothetical protein